MAEKLYSNKTKIVQGIYKDGELVRVIPGGTIKLEEKEMAKYLRHFQEEGIKKLDKVEVKTDTKKK